LSRDGDSFTSVEGTWKIPSVSATSGGRNADWSPVSCWIGIDGYGPSRDVLQAGCDVQVASPGILEVILWYEWFPEDYVKIDDIVASVDDELIIVIRADPGMQSATIVIRNVTTNHKTRPYVVSAPEGTTLKGDSAEWIVEALKNANQIPEVAQFTPIEFANCKAETSGGVTLQPGDGDALYILNNSNPPITIARGEIVNPTTVRITYA